MSLCDFEDVSLVHSSNDDIVLVDPIIDRQCMKSSLRTTLCSALVDQLPLGTQPTSLL